MSTPRPPITLPYKVLRHGSDILLDIYIPASFSEDSRSDASVVPSIPAVIYFHGGGLIVGNKETFIPSWLMDRILSLGYVFISPNYQLIPPATGHDIKDDVIDLFSFISKTEFLANGTNQRFTIDSEKMVVTGSSAGGLCGYLAASYAVPRPKACLSIYGQGGNFLTPFYLQPKLEPFYNNEPLLDPKDFEQYLYPASKTLSPEIDIHIPFPPAPPPDTPRMELQKLYVQMGTFVDHYTGAHDPSLSHVLRSRLNTYQDSKGDSLELEEIIPKEHQAIFPNILAKGAKDLNWPRTLLIHGSGDQVVSVDESLTMQEALKASGVDVELVVAKDQNHAFDYDPEVEKEWGWIFDKALEFLKRAVEGAVGVVPNSYSAI